MSYTNELVYKFTRGKEYSVNVHVINNESIVFSNLKVPENTEFDVIKALYDDAERATLLRLEEGSYGVLS